MRAETTMQRGQSFLETAICDYASVDTYVAMTRRLRYNGVSATC